MEIGLGAAIAQLCAVGMTVLILVVVEIGLGDTLHEAADEIIKSLNPCCSGNRSRRKEP